MNVTEEQVNRWATAISESEEEHCQSALSQVTDAMRERFGNAVRILPKGSHKNRTNIRADSDVDVAVIHTDYYFPDTGSLTDSDKQLHKAQFVPATYSYEEFKSDVHRLLEAKFGSSFVERKSKCIRVKGNTSRVNADVVPAYEYRRYRSLDNVEAEGIALKPDGSSVIVSSFPEQHYDNGVIKNGNTSLAFKAVVRVLKNTRNEMVERNLFPKDVMPSFFIECLVWNAPNSCFTHDSYREDARSVALTVWGDMRDLAKANLYAEISDLKWLFRGSPRTPAQGEAFMLAAWSYLAA